MKRWFNHIVLGVAVLTGVIGAWSLRDAVGQYVDTSRAYAAVTMDYQPGSFTWLEPDGERAGFTLVVVNGAPRAATVESLDVNLYFGDDFAGTNYAAFTPVTLAAGETQTIAVTITVTAKSKLPLAGSTALSLDGTTIFRFEGIQRARGLNVSDTIGIVPLPSARWHTP